MLDGYQNSRPRGEWHNRRELGNLFRVVGIQSPGTLSAEERKETLPLIKTS